MLLARSVFAVLKRYNVSVWGKQASSLQAQFSQSVTDANFELLASVISSRVRNKMFDFCEDVCHDH